MHLLLWKNAFRLRSDRAYSLIALNVEKDLQVHISSVTDPLAGVTCFKCKLGGHMAKNCPLINKPDNKPNTGRRESSNMAELEGVALISSTKNRSDEWFIDSAVTKHMTNNLQKHFGELCWIPTTEEHLSWRHHSDSCSRWREGETSNWKQFSWCCSRITQSVACTKVKQEPTFSTCNGIDGSRNSEWDLSLVIYYLTSSTHSIPSSMLKFQTDSARSLKVWHCRLGHLNHTYVNQLVKKKWLMARTVM